MNQCAFFKVIHILNGLHMLEARSPIIKSVVKITNILKSAFPFKRKVKAVS